MDNTQHVATYCYTVAKRTQHVAPNNVAICYVGMLRLFGQGLSLLSGPSYTRFREIQKRSFIPTVHTNPSRKRSFLWTLFQPEKFENAGFAF